MFFNQVQDFFNRRQNIALGNYTVSTKLAFNLLIALVAIGVLIAFASFGIVELLLLFVAIFLGLTLLEQLFVRRPEEVLANDDVENLVDNPVVEEIKGDSNGSTAVPCFNVPYKVVSTQYGDKALQAGFNENVEPYQQGAVDFDSPDFMAYKECMGNVSIGESDLPRCGVSG